MPQLKISGLGLIEAVFLLFLISYGLKFSELVDFDSVLLAWVFIVVFALYWVRKECFFVAGVYYFLIFSVYVLAYFFISGYRDGGDFFRNAVSHFFLTAIFLQVLQLPRESFSPSRVNFFVVCFCKAGIFLVLYWIFFIFNGAQYAGESLVSQYGGANYLTTSDLLALFVLSLMVGGSVSRYWIAVGFVVGVVALVFLGSRASLVIFLFAAIFFSSNSQSPWKKILVTFSSLVAVFFIGLLVFEFVDSSLLFRVETLFDMSQDESRQARDSFFRAFLQRLDANSGCYLYPCPPPAGEYVHNVVSVHEYFGLVGSFLTFLLFLNLIFAFLNGYSPRFRPVFVYSFLLFLTARSWVSLIFPVCIAYLLDALIFSLTGKK